MNRHLCCILKWAFLFVQRPRINEESRRRTSTYEETFVLIDKVLQCRIHGEVKQTIRSLLMISRLSILVSIVVECWLTFRLIDRLLRAFVSVSVHDLVQGTRSRPSRNISLEMLACALAGVFAIFIQDRSIQMVWWKNVFLPQFESNLPETYERIQSSHQKDSLQWPKIFCCSLKK